MFTVDTDLRAGFDRSVRAQPACQRIAKLIAFGDKARRCRGHVDDDT
jgi:hypothetical protein